jgi:hypothetical protein
MCKLQVTVIIRRYIIVLFHCFHSHYESLYHFSNSHYNLLPGFAIIDDTLYHLQNYPISFQILFSAVSVRLQNPSRLSFITIATASFVTRDHFCRLWSVTFSQSESESESHIATDGQSVSPSWCRAPSRAHDQIFNLV